jgi:hypothetical protein
MSWDDAQPDEVTRLLRRVRGEFREMPGLRLSLAQARRLWNMDDHVCSTVLDDLVADGFLRRTDQGLYVRVSPGA